MGSTLLGFPSFHVSGLSHVFAHSTSAPFTAIFFLPVGVTVTGVTMVVSLALILTENGLVCDTTSRPKSPR